MKKKNFEIRLNLQEQLPSDFSIKYEELEDWFYGKYRPNKKATEKELNLNISSWKEFEIIYEDVSKIAGRFSINAIEKNEKMIEVPFDFMIAKQMIEKTKQRIRWKSPYYNSITEKQGMTIHKKVVDQLMLECLERLRQYKAFLAQKKLQESLKEEDEK